MFFTALEAQTLITGFGTLKVVGLGLLVSGGGCFVGPPPFPCRKRYTLLTVAATTGSQLIKSVTKQTNFINQVPLLTRGVAYLLFFFHFFIFWGGINIILFLVGPLGGVYNPPFWGDYKPPLRVGFSYTPHLPLTRFRRLILIIQLVYSPSGARASTALERQLLWSVQWSASVECL